MKLLNIDANAKTVKGQKKGYLTGVLYLAPFNVSGINVCPMAELANCHKTCLFVQGRASISPGSAKFTADNGVEYPDNNILRCRIKRTKLFHSDREGFLLQLEKEINALIRKADRMGLIPTVRLNGTSDIRWENIKLGNGETLFTQFPDLIFYDYTKINNRKNIPANYHLSWSYSEASAKYASMRPKALNWVVVFDKPDFPDTFLGRKVIDGDESDLRFLDDSGIVVGLKAKGSAKKDTSGFVVRLAA
jgi:hypothetical protein